MSKVSTRRAKGKELEDKVADLLLGLLKAWEYRHKKNSWVMIDDDLKELK